MAIKFDKVLNMTTYTGNTEPVYVGNLMLSNEPKNEIYQFYIVDNLTADKMAQLERANYNTLQWSKQVSHITKAKVKRIGIKSFPRIGAIAFYSLLYEDRSFVLAPLFIQSERQPKPSFSVAQAENSLTFTMQSPEDITYMCWRVVLRCGHTAFEYVTYADTLTIENPYLSGTYDCYCVGYVGEGEATSADSDHVTLNLVGTGKDPLDKFETYTKLEIDAMLGNIGALLDKLNGVVI